MPKPELEIITKTYKDDNGDEHEVTGYNIEQFPEPMKHDFYQEGRFLMCNCHPEVSKRMPDGKNLIKKEGKFLFV